MLSPFLHLFHSKFYKRIFPISRRTIFLLLFWRCFEISRCFRPRIYHSIPSFAEIQRKGQSGLHGAILNWTGSICYSNLPMRAEVGRWKTVKMIPHHRACVITKALQCKPSGMPIRPEIFPAIDETRFLWYPHFVVEIAAFWRWLEIFLTWNF